ncbi:Transmembrane protein 115 [Golovinomyces cichoracearum]|uniref:Transmembrane protein 115 n=1 Tax=Golovinomyces cichoracearum TaxID=62708 RepID=A0A420HBY7_9PEZI|nr:Transmembrane protein 115 [Golovinomyces cichoracearum]
MPLRANLPSVVRILLPVLIFQSILGLAIKYRHSSLSSEVLVAWLFFLPSHSLRYPWTILTATLVENNLVSLGLATLTIFYGGRYLERAWTSVEFAKFLLVISLIPNIICCGALLSLFALTGNPQWTNTIIHGTLSIQVSFLVAFSQLIPTHTVTIFKGIISVRVTRLPILHVLGVTLLVMTPLLSLASFFIDVTGFLTSWTYLRFYKEAFPDLQTSQSSLRGDASDTFAFAGFFPDPVKPLIATISNKLFDFLVILRICTPFSAADVSASNGELFMQRGTPGSARAEAERRRALALKALDQRLHAATANHAKTSNSFSSIPDGPSMQVHSQSAGLELERLRGDTSCSPKGTPDEERMAP